MTDLEAFYEASENRALIELARRDWNKPCKHCKLVPCDCEMKEEDLLDK